MFFVTSDHIPEGVGFQSFGLTHILWLLAGLILCTAACIFYRRLSAEKQKTVLMVLGIYIFLQEMVKNLVLILLGEFSWGYLPFHLCGINILLIAFDTIKQTKTVRSFLYYFAIPGAMLALLFPNWTKMPVWNFFHLHSFTIHILLVLYPLLLVTTNQVSTDLKSAFKGVVLLVIMAIPVYGLNLLWDTNFMFLMKPDSGNPLELFEKLLGSHLWGFPILLPVVILVMYLPILIFKKRAKKQIQQLTALILVIILCCGCSSGNRTSQRPQLNTNFTQAESAFSFSPLSSEKVTLSQDNAAAVLAAVKAIQPTYAHQDLYQLEEVKKRLDFDASVAAHQFSALNTAGTLDAAHLTEVVKNNNAAFLATKPFGYSAADDNYIADICDFIVTIIHIMEEKYPDIDWARVYCNLGNLKILYDTGMLSYAQVSANMVLGISKHNTEILLNLKGDDGFTRVLTHEIMHIIQIGCTCEDIENCSRRAGIALYWDDFTLNTTDWTWLAEGSAERNMCTITGGKAVTYQYKIDYLCSMSMSVLLRDSVKADTMETLCFQSDPQLLFDAFGCETQAELDELLNMMITLQVLQMQPSGFHQLYKEKTGKDLLEDEDAMNQFSYSLKPAICITLAKEFYENLVVFLQQNPLTCNDLFFLINLFEGHLNQHLNYKNANKAEINQPFFEVYNQMRSALFYALEQDNPDLDMDALYDAYDITAAGDNLLNARLSMLPKEKLAFLAERAQWQSEQLGLGEKVPQ